jgi:hypothetical protein
VFPFYEIFSLGSVKYPEVSLTLKLIYNRNAFQILDENAFYMMFYLLIQKRLGVGKAFLKIFYFTSLLIIFLHCHACIIFFFGKLTAFPESTWAKPEYAVVLHEDISKQYFWALFASVANTFPVSGFLFVFYSFLKYIL